MRFSFTQEDLESLYKKPINVNHGTGARSEHDLTQLAKEEAERLQDFFETAGDKKETIRDTWNKILEFFAFVGVASPDLDTWQLNGINLSVLTHEFENRKHLGDDPQLILSPVLPLERVNGYYQELPSWQDIFQIIVKSELVTNPLKTRKDGDGLFIAKQINKPELLTKIFEAEINRVRKTNKYWFDDQNKIRWSINILNRSKLHSLGGYPYHFFSGKHITLSEYLTAQAMNIFFQNSLLDEFQSSWIETHQANDSISPLTATFQRNYGQIRIYPSATDQANGRLVTRLPVRF